MIIKLINREGVKLYTKKIFSKITLQKIIENDLSLNEILKDLKEISYCSDLKIDYVFDNYLKETSNLMNNCKCKKHLETYSKEYKTYESKISKILDAIHDYHDCNRWFKPKEIHKVKIIPWDSGELIYDWLNLNSYNQINFYINFIKEQSKKDKIKKVS